MEAIPTTEEEEVTGCESIQTPPVSAYGNGNGDGDDWWQPLVGGARPTPQHWTTRDHCRAAAKIAPVWFLSNMAYNASLKYTSITSSTVLASTGSLFTFLFALIARDEHFTLYKFFGIILGMAGTIMTGLHDIKSNGGQDDDNADPGSYSSDDKSIRLWGDFLGMLSAVGYGGYALLVRVLCPRDESLMSMQLFLGFVGLWNFVLLSPIAIYQGFFRDTGLTWFVLGCLVIKGLLDNALSDYLWARSVVLTSATVATVGLGLTIPLAFASDLLFGRPNVLNTASVLGALSVLSGFILVNLGQQQEEETVDHSSGLPREEVSREAEISDEHDRISHMSLEYRDEPNES